MPLHEFAIFLFSLKKIEFPSFAVESFVSADELLLKLLVAAFNLPAPKVGKKMFKHGPKTI